MPRIAKTAPGGKIAQNIRALNDRDLGQLVTQLRFSTKLEQSMLATAVLEQRRRRRVTKGSIHD